MYHGKYESKKGAAAAPVTTPSEETAPTRRKPKEKKKVRVGSVIFYLIYFLLIAAFFVMLSGALKALTAWLGEYEASQPNVKCQQVFEELFTDPDWEHIYALANETDTSYDTAESYATYMEQKVGNSELYYTETSAGLSGDHKYVVKLGNEKIAVYTLTTDTPDGTSIEGLGEIPNIKEWRLGSIQLFYERTAHVTVTAQPDRIVTVNGNVLNEDYVISSTSTVAEEYLPEGLSGFRMQTMYVDELMVAPEVVVTDQSGNPVEMTYDEATQTYTEVIVPPVLGDEKATIVAAIQTYGKYMIEAVKSGQVAQYFDPKEPAYKFITRSDVSWTQNYLGYDFTEAQITDLYRYSDDFFSVHVNMTMNVTRSDHTIRDFPVVGTFFFRYNGSKWMVTEMTNVSVQEQKTEVRLTYLLDNETISTGMVAADSNTLTPPAVTVPEGKVFSGWFRETVDESGNTTMSLVFQPDENGNVTLPSDYVLEPMVLHALFEKESA